MLEKELSSYVKVYKLHGGLKKKEREGIMAELQNLPEDEPRVIIATGKYAGRLHRDYYEKKKCVFMITLIRR